MMTILMLSIMAVLSVAILLSARQHQQTQKQITNQQKQIKKLSVELNATSNGAIGLGQRILNIDKQIKDIKSRHQDMLSFGNDDQFQKRTYKQANQLALMGASIEDLRQSCELSQGEAELLSHMSSIQAH